ncbi:MAG TPA: MarR family winged helix-turn-helix transcriptional regulator [Sphingobium sp.]|nr:MarR family winged helix-turn-helix transcriptional regulator [Sphingobium sp.]
MVLEGRVRLPHKASVSSEGEVVRRKEQAEGTERIPHELRRRVLAEQGDWYSFRMILIGNYYSGELFATLARDYGMLRDDFLILAYLSDFGEMTANLICALSGRPKNSISRGVIKLTGNKLVEARAGTEDRRYTFLNVTAEGRRMYEETIALFREREQEVFGCLTVKEKQSLDKALTKVLENWFAKHG